MQINARSLGQAVGARLQQLREERGLRQADIVASARRVGLRWTQPTVVAIENGRRDLTFGEVLLLPCIINDATERASTFPRSVEEGLQQRKRRSLAVADLFPPDEWVQLAPLAFARGDAVADLFHGAPATDRVKTPAGAEAAALGQSLRSLNRAVAQVWPDAPYPEAEAAAADAGREVEQRMATRLGTSPYVVSLAARRLWHQGLTAERDRRAGGQGQAHAGHATRALTQELRAFLIETGVISARAKRASRRQER